MTDEITLGGITITTPQQDVNRMSLLLWGPSGAGKTTFACTAPGKKLLINFDPDGPQSLAERDDVMVLDLSDKPSEIITQLKMPDPLRLTKFLEEHDDIGTVIVDSASSLGQLALHQAVKFTGRTSSLERPGIPGFTARNTYMLEILSNLLKVTKKAQRHFILIAHEDTPDRDSEGNTIGITILLSGKLPDHYGLRMSEIWHLSETNGKRTIAVRPCRMRKPMKTRMFKTTGKTEFTLSYDVEKDDDKQEHTIANWYEQWEAGGGRKIDVP